MRLEARKAGNGKIHLVHNGDANDGQNYWELDHKNVREVMERMDEIASEYEKEAKQPKEKEEKSVDEA